MSADYFGRKRVPIAVKGISFKRNWSSASVAGELKLFDFISTPLVNGQDCASGFRQGKMTRTLGRTRITARSIFYLVKALQRMQHFNKMIGVIKKSWSQFVDAFSYIKSLHGLASLHLAVLCPRCNLTSAYSIEW